MIHAHRQSGTYRELSINRNTIDFSSNDYLGLSQNQTIRQGLIEALQNDLALGSTGSRLISGHTFMHEQVEIFIAELYGTESALLFSSGFMANLGVLTALGSLGAEFFSDELNHASLVDGIRLSKAKKNIFHHNDMGHLEEEILRSSAKLKVVVTESVFSMDGDLAPVEDLVSLANKHGLWLVVDEAHATGVFGKRSLGLLEDFQNANLISIHTGGKALGGQGAFVLSDGKFRELLINQARSFIYSTAIAPLNALQMELALRWVSEHPWEGKSILKKAMQFHAKLNLLAETTNSESQIIPWHLHSNERALSAANALQEKGFAVRAIRSPTVPAGTERLRLTLKKFHQDHELESLLLAIEDWV